MPKEAIVVGCGVIGLTTAITLQKNNYSVKIITNKLPAETTSAVAAAVWLPYEVKPYDKVKIWSSSSYDAYVEFAQDETSGVSMIDMTIVIGSEEDAWWKDALPKEKIRRANENELPGDHKLGYVLNVPMIETQLHLQFLLERFETEGGTVEMKQIDDLNSFDQNKIIINCTGLAAKELTDDKELYPIQGQIVLLKRNPNIKCTLSEILEGENKDKLAYIVPRSDYTVLGGTAEAHNYGLRPSDQEASAIIKRCQSLDSLINEDNYVSTIIGLRPGRSEIRLEREGNIIHNYGHGGGGYTVAWGCANSVLNMLN